MGSPKIPASENGLYRHAQELLKQGRRLKALNVYAEVLQLQLPHFKRVVYTTSSDPIRCTIKLILGILYEIFPRLGSPCGDCWPYFVEFVTDCIDALSEPDDRSMLFTLRAIADYMRMEYYDGSKLAHFLYGRVLRQIRNSSEYMHEKMHIVQELAKLCVDRWSHVTVSKETLIWSTQERIIREGLAQMENVLAYDHPDILMFYYEFGLVYLEQDMDLNAVSLLERAYTAPKRILGGEHNNTATSLKSLFDCHSEQEDFGKAASLMQSAMISADVIETCAATKTTHFWSWFQSESYQGKLALLCTPGADFYRENSSTYFRPLHQIKLIPAFPLDPFPRPPVKIMSIYAYLTRIAIMPIRPKWTPQVRVL